MKKWLYIILISLYTYNTYAGGDTLRIIATDTTAALDRNCEGFFDGFNFYIEGYKPGKPLLLMVTEDLDSDGMVDRVHTNQYPSLLDRNWTIQPSLSSVYGFPLTTIWKDHFKDFKNDPNTTVEISTPINGGDIVTYNIYAHETESNIRGKSSAKVTPIDTLGPAPFCLSLLSLDYSDYDSLNQHFTTTVIAKDFVIGAFDACTKNKDLIYYLNDRRPPFGQTIVLDSQVYLITYETPMYIGDSTVFLDGDDIHLPKASSETVRKYYNNELDRWDPLTRTTSRVIPRHTIDTQYNLPVYTEDTSGNYDFCNIQLFSKPVNISEQIDPSYTIFPNPFESELTIQHNIPIEEIRLFTITGQPIPIDHTLVSMQESRVILDDPPYRGMYILQIYNGSSWSRIKITH